MEIFQSDYEIDSRNQIVNRNLLTCSKNYQLVWKTVNLFKKLQPSLNKPEELPKTVVNAEMTLLVFPPNVN